MTNNCRLILIGGGTCSGKTTIAKAIGRRLDDLKTVIISHDNYYHDLSSYPPEECKNYNFDHPSAIDAALLVEDVKAMLKGEAVNVPDYDFITHKRSEGTLCVAFADVIILEGIFALYYQDLLELSDLKIFVDTDADIRLTRRLIRDTKDRGYDVEGVLDMYLDKVKPSHDAFIDPSKKNADIIIPGDRDFDKVLYMLNGYLLYELVNH
mgnify:FL=1